MLIIQLIKKEINLRNHSLFDLILIREILKSWCELGYIKIPACFEQTGKVK